MTETPEPAGAGEGSAEGRVPLAEVPPPPPRTGEAPPPDASQEAPPELPAPKSRSPWLPALAAWLVPGAGHLVIARPWPALFVAVPIWGLFAWGLALSGFENVHWGRHPFMFVLHALAGLPSVAVTLLTPGLEITRPYPHHTVGDLYTMVAGLLNLVAMADVWARCTDGDPEVRLARAHAAAEPAASAEPAAAEAHGG